jgi:hypothetical protein
MLMKINAEGLFDRVHFGNVEFKAAAVTVEVEY